MSRFTLERGHWYACEIIGDEFDADRCSYTPIKVFAVMPGNTGKRQFELDFHHAKYPARVQHKRYRLRTIERGERYLLTHAGNIKFGIKGVVARSSPQMWDLRLPQRNRGRLDDRLWSVRQRASRFRWSAGSDWLLGEGERDLVGGWAAV